MSSHLKTFYLSHENTPRAFTHVEDLVILARYIQRGDEGALDEVVIWFDPDIEEYLEGNTVTFHFGPDAPKPPEMWVFKLYHPTTKRLVRNGQIYSIELGTWSWENEEKSVLRFDLTIEVEPYNPPAADPEIVA